LSRSEPPPRVVTIAPSLPFAETLARGLIARLGADDDPLALSRVTIYLPTRRAARSFADVFARVPGGAALLPDFKALGDVDEDEFLFDAASEDLDLPPAISPVRRQLLLATLVRRWDETRGHKALGFVQAHALADGLARLMDELEGQDADLAKLDDLAPLPLAEHWAEVAGFLKILRDHWPGILDGENAMNPIARRNRMLRALARRLEAHPPEGPVIAAGSTGSIPATGELLRVIARLPTGTVVLPGLDRRLDDESWQGLDPGHPQFGMKQLLDRIGIAREGVADWSDDTPLGDRERVLSETLRPAPTTDAWRALAEQQNDDIARGFEGLSLIETADPAEEASVIALALREALETPKRTAALVTPDRTLARRVAAELRRWDVTIDDSAGQPLAHTVPGAFLCLLAEAADSGFAPVPLMALLKHPLAAMGDAGWFRRNARELDRLLRGPRPDAGLEGIARKAGEAPTRLQSWLRSLTTILAPLAEALSKSEIHVADVVAAHLEAAEALCDLSELWRGEAGEQARDLMAELQETTADLPVIESGAYAPLFQSLARARSVRPAYGRHPRLAILGPQEARLLSFDLVVLGGLNEGTWPRAVQTDPWFSRPMRSVLGLEQPERTTGLSAHDFATLAAGPSVILTHATRADGTPTVASRWVQRLMQLRNGLGLEESLKPPRDYVALARALGDAGRVERIRMPVPKPPVAARPVRLPVTDIEKWVRDPYWVYARRILKLRVLDPLDAEIGAPERGSAVHKALELFVTEMPGPLPDDAAVRLCEIADTVFAAAGTPKGTLALWRPRFLRAASWFVELDRLRRAAIGTSFTEAEGECAITGTFTLHGIADRIDLMNNGCAQILDYKTGSVPTPGQIKAFLAPQLLLEAAMLAEGAFAPVGRAVAEKLSYVKFSGGREPGRFVDVDVKLVDEAMRRLRERIVEFADPEKPYRPRVKPYRVDVPGDYDHLARVREWSLSGWEDEEE
jgi:ATP-dependent helicase/nuclease subunit B